MATTIEYNIKVNDGQAQASVKELDKGLKDVNKNIQEIDTSSKELQLENRIKKIDGSVKILAGSLQTAVGALGLLGVESEALGKFEEKAASAIAVGIGIKDLTEGFKQLIPFIGSARGAVTKFFNAIIKNPIGAIVAAIAALTVGFAKYVSTVTNDVVPTTEVLKNFFLSLGNATAFANRMSQSYLEGLEALDQKQKDLNLDRTIKVLQAFGENTIDLEIQRAEKQIQALEEGSEEYENKLTELSVLRAKKAKQLADQEAEATRKAREEALEKILFADEARKFSEEMYELAGEEDIREYARGVVKGFDKIKEEGFNIASLVFVDPEEDEDEIFESVQKQVESFARGLEESLDAVLNKRQRWDDFFNLANQTFDAVANLSQQRYDRELINLERERSAIENNAFLSEDARVKALEAVEAKERQLEIRRIKAERDQFTLKQTLIAAESILETQLLVQKLKAEGQLMIFRAKAAGTEIATTAAVQVAKAQTSIGAYVAALGPFGLAAFAASIGFIIASIISARKKANAQIAALTGASVGGGAIDSSAAAPSIPTPSQSTPIGIAPEAIEQGPIRAYVLTGDVTSGAEAQAKLNSRRTLD